MTPKTARRILAIERLVAIPIAWCVGMLVEILLGNEWGEQQGTRYDEDYPRHPIPYTYLGSASRWARGYWSAFFIGITLGMICLGPISTGQMTFSQEPGVIIAPVLVVLLIRLTWLALRGIYQGFVATKNKAKSYHSELTRIAALPDDKLAEAGALSEPETRQNGQVSLVNRSTR